MVYNRFLPLVTAGFIFVSSEMFFIWPHLIYVSFIFGVLIFFFTCRQFLLASQKKEKWWNLFLLPFLFWCGTVALAVILPSRFLVQFLFLVNMFFVLFYFRTLYYYLLEPKRYQMNSLANFSAYGNFLAFYFLSSALYGFQILLGVRIWPLMLILLLVVILITSQVFWANRLNRRVGFVYILLLSISLVELAWSASFTSLSFYILGLILAVCYYILIGLIRFYLLGRLTRQTIKLYLIFGLGSIFFVLLTAKWIAY
jgi:hypothetical protein